ncbi:hypothetical protein N9B05_02425 [Mariniblastus sp.]|nr:hypothetical protein [Mariniblastus sp.]
MLQPSAARIISQHLYRNTYIATLNFRGAAPTHNPLDNFMKYPACKTSDLVRTQYEGVSVNHCEQYVGYLIKRAGLHTIKTNWNAVTPSSYNKLRPTPESIL